MTPEKPDIDFKLDGAKWEFIYLGRDVLEPIYGEGLMGSANLNQCPHWSTERPVLTVLFFF